nr:hypothetical protein [Tanacetum cinerariifolium]
MQTSSTQKYPSLIDTFFVTHTVNGEIFQDEDHRIYFESGSASGSGGCGDKEEGVDHQDDEDEDGDGDALLCYIWEKFRKKSAVQAVSEKKSRRFPGDM